LLFNYFRNKRNQDACGLFRTFLHPALLFVLRLSDFQEPLGSEEKIACEESFSPVVLVGVLVGVSFVVAHDLFAAADVASLEPL
jgi:hypothetical protein